MAIHIALYAFTMNMAAMEAPTAIILYPIRMLPKHPAFMINMVII